MQTVLGGLLILHCAEHCSDFTSRLNLNYSLQIPIRQISTPMTFPCLSLEICFFCYFQQSFPYQLKEVYLFGNFEWSFSFHISTLQGSFLLMVNKRIVVRQNRKSPFPPTGVRSKTSREIGQKIFSALLLWPQNV